MTIEHAILCVPLGHYKTMLELEYTHRSVNCDSSPMRSDNVPLIAVSDISLCTAIAPLSAGTLHVNTCYTPNAHLYA